MELLEDTGDVERGWNLTMHFEQPTLAASAL